MYIFQPKSEILYEIIYIINDLKIIIDNTKLT